MPARFSLIARHCSWGRPAVRLAMARAVDDDVVADGADAQLAAYDWRGRV